MSKRSRIILATAIPAVAVGLTWWALSPLPPSPPDPVYGGHPLSHWVNGAANPPEFDSNTIPYLVSSLKKREGAVRRFGDRVLGPEFPDWLFTRLPLPAWVVRFNSCQLLSRMGAKARPAIPELIRVMTADENNTVRAVAAGALENIANRDDQMAVAALIAATKDTDPTVKMRATKALTQIDPQAAANAGVK